MAWFSAACGLARAAIDAAGASRMSTGRHRVEQHERRHAARDGIHRVLELLLQERRRLHDEQRIEAIPDRIPGCDLLHVMLAFQLRDDGPGRRVRPVS